MSTGARGTDCQELGLAAGQEASGKLEDGKAGRPVKGHRLTSTGTNGGQGHLALVDSTESFLPFNPHGRKKMSLRYKITKCVGSKLRSYLAHLSLDAEVIYQKSQSLWWRQDTRNLLVFFTNIPHPQATPARIFVSFIENSQELSGVSTT